MVAKPITPVASVMTDTTSARIHNPRLLLLIRLIVLGMLVSQIILISMKLPKIFSREICEGSQSQCNTSTTISTETVSKFSQAGSSLQLFVIFSGIIFLLFYLTLIILSVMLFWRKSDDWMALLSIATFTVLNGLVSFSISRPIGIAFVLLYPTGRFQPRWTAILVILNIVLSIVYPSITEMLQAPGVLILCGILIYRYKHFFSPLQRQQTKWVIVSFTLTALWISVVFAITPSPNLYIFYTYASYLITLAVVITIPVTVWLAILRYRLWDIDLVINRSLVYGVVTVLLLLIVFIGTSAIQIVIGNTQSGVALAISAVGAALLFNPTRKRVQSFVDRRIYGLNFDLNQLAAAQKLPNIKKSGALSGQKLGGYHVLDVIGKGGMGEVYKGQAADGQVVALKVLPDDLAQQEDFRKRFEREGQALTALQHPNIVRMIGSGSSDGIVYLAMEYLDGNDLSWKLKLQGTLSLDETRDILRGLCAALDYAHQHGFIHRDIKPSNVMLRQSRDHETLEAVLMDFGVAKAREAQTAITGTGGIGTIGYMAPEQIMAAKEVDHRADIYALGVMAYEMLTGELPFKGSPAQVMFAHLQQPPPDPRDVNEDLPSPVAYAILRALAKQPDDRFATATEFVAELG